MPATATKHKDTKVLNLRDFRGGMNLVASGTQLEENECMLIENMYFEGSTGKLRTRHPLHKYSTSAAVASTPVRGLYKWEGFWFLECNYTLYYLDSSEAPQTLGALNGQGKPTFAPFNDKLLVASGGTLQYTEIGASPIPSALADVDDAPQCSYVMEKNGRIVTAGGEYSDRIVESNYFDETTWGSTDYADVGYRDGLSIVGIIESSDGLYTVFKRGESGVRTYLVTTLSSTAPASQRVGEVHCARSHHSIVKVANRIFFLEDTAVGAMAASLDSRYRESGSIFDQIPGFKLGSAFESSVECFSVVYPKDAQVWFVPSPEVPVAYVYNYLLNCWVKFDFTSSYTRYLHSAFYDVTDQTLYLGCDDGYVYYYNRLSQHFTDENTAGVLTSYKQKLHTKVFVPEDGREVTVKAPLLRWLDLQDGKGTVGLYSDYGETEIYASGSEELTNGGFELGNDAPSSWTAGNSADLDRHADPRGGTYCLEINENGAAYPTAEQSISVAGGETYLFSFHVKAGTEASWQAYLYDDTNSTTLHSACDYSGEATASFVKHTQMVVIPSTCGSVSVVLNQICAKDAGTTLLFDDVSLKQVYGMFTIAADQITVYSTASGEDNATRVFETQEGESGERRVWVGNSINNERWHFDASVEDYQFKLEVASGGMALDSIGAIVAPSRRIN